MLMNCPSRGLLVREKSNKALLINSKGWVLFIAKSVVRYAPKKTGYNGRSKIVTLQKCTRVALSSYL